MEKLKTNKNTLIKEASYSYEMAVWKKNKLVIGIDEVGRGSLAGPVLAAALALYPYRKHPLLLDSKILTETDRLVAYAWLRQNSLFSIGIIRPSYIDRHNIYQATQQAMYKALYGLISKISITNYSCTTLIVDAMPLRLSRLFKNFTTLIFPRAESASASVAAASIVAKITRDEIMKKTSNFFSTYQFEKHRGYGTKTHRTALTLHGLSLIHRLSFLRKIVTQERQSSIF